MRAAVGGIEGEARLATFDVWTGSFNSIRAVMFVRSRCRGGLLGCHKIAQEPKQSATPPGFALPGAIDGNAAKVNFAPESSL
jgi:hypothetical protein